VKRKFHPVLAKIRIKNPDKPKIFIKKNVKNHSYHQFYPVLAKVRINRGLLYYQNQTPKLRAEPKSISTRIMKHVCKARDRCRRTDKLSVLSEPLHTRRIGSYYLDPETSSVSSVFIARGYLRSNA